MFAYRITGDGKYCVYDEWKKDNEQTLYYVDTLKEAQEKVIERNLTVYGLRYHGV